MTTLDLVYEPDGETLRRYFWDDHFLSGIRGPFGSGKSYASCFRIMRHHVERTHGSDGKRRSRWAVIRNTFPELKTTTMKTWNAIFPKHLGAWRDSGPPTHVIETPDSHLEVMFVALDSEADVKKLLSMDLTAAWVNEARETPYAIIDALTGRVGRYPSATDGSRGYTGIIMDTNSPDTEHWWYSLAERDYKTEFGQAVLNSTAAAEAELRKLGLLAEGKALFKFFAQPGGRTPNAENIKNLQPGYYVRMMAGKRADWIKVYIDGQYGFVQDGKPVIPEYNDSLHCVACRPIPGIPLIVGGDWGLTPAGVVTQQAPNGQIRFLDEIATQRAGAIRFGEELKAKMARDFAGFSWEVVGDPSGEAASQTDERTVYDILSTLGIQARPAETNDGTIRREAIAQPLSRLIDGAPGLIVDPKCSTVRKGLMGGYRYGVVHSAGGPRQSDKPVKSFYSHAVEAAEYACMGHGEGYKVITPPDTTGFRLQIAAIDDMNPRGVFREGGVNLRNFPDAIEE